MDQVKRNNNFGKFVMCLKKLFNIIISVLLSYTTIIGVPTTIVFYCMSLHGNANV